MLGHFVLSLGAVTGLVLGGAWVLKVADRWSGGNPPVLFVVAVALWIGLARCVYVSLREVESHDVVVLLIRVVGVVAVLGGVVFTLLSLCWWDRQVLHDRGVTLTGAVGRHWEVGTGAGLDPGPIPYYDVVGPDRRERWAFWSAEAKDRPGIGTPVTITVDPEEEAQPQLGGRPGAPPWQVATVARDIALVSALVVAASGAAARR
ncbi:hypothetical protein [Kitasatospora sp. NPDC004289]